MPLPDRSRSPLQERSRRTHDELLAAAERVFAERGLGAATVAEICARAGVAVGTFYGRFEDKHALLEAYYARFFQRGLELFERRYAEERWRGRDGPELVRDWVAWRVRRYARNQRLLHALLSYVRAHPDPAFRREAARFRAGVVPRLVAMLLARGAARRHPEPELAVRLAITTVASVTQELLIFGEQRAPDLVFPRAVLTRELTRTTLLALGFRT